MFFSSLSCRAFAQPAQSADVEPLISNLLLLLCGETRIFLGMALIIPAQWGSSEELCGKVFSWAVHRGAIIFCGNLDSQSCQYNYLYVLAKKKKKSFFATELHKTLWKTGTKININVIRMENYINIIRDWKNEASAFSRCQQVGVEVSSVGRWK